MKQLHILIVVIAIAVLSVLAWYETSFEVSKATTATVSLPPELADASSFELGQYYFNHDDDPALPYDLYLARRYYNKALREDPVGNDLTWYQLGRIDFLEGKFDTALYKFDKQLEYFGDSVPNVHYMIGLTYGYKARQSGDVADWERGAEGFLRYIEFDPEAPWARVDLTWIYFAQGKYDEMLEPLEVGLRFTPNNPWLLNMYGLALLNTGDTLGARNNFLLAAEEARELTPEDWGNSYPGNHPDSWARGLAEFQTAIEKNIALTEAGN
ncbi:MAG: hypothetical protein AAGA35_02490 [Patescibacteria group bacterium]